jgi:hypothetical protein
MFLTSLKKLLKNTRESIFNLSELLVNIYICSTMNLLPLNDPITDWLLNFFRLEISGNQLRKVPSGSWQAPYLKPEANSKLQYAVQISPATIFFKIKRYDSLSYSKPRVF